MNRIIFIAGIFLSVSADAQVAIKVMMEAPMLYDLSHVKYSVYEKSRGVIIPGIEFEKTFLTDANETGRVNYSIGLSYLSSKSSSTYLTSDHGDDDEFYSEIDYTMWNIPVAIRGEVQSSQLLENSYLGMEFGLLINVWTKYRLKEVASIKSYDVDGEINGETLYIDEKDLANKTTCSVFWGLHGSIRRFYYGVRFNLITITDMYSDKYKPDWNIPVEYSIYDRAHATQGKLKQPYMNLLLGFKIN
jgi:hypothetical protein